MRDKIHIIELDKLEDKNDALELEEEFTVITGRKWVPIIFFNVGYLGTEVDFKVRDENGTLQEKLISGGIIQVFINQ